MATLRPPSWSGRCLKRAALADAFEGQENRFGPADNGGGCPAPGRNAMLTRSSIRIHHTRCGLFLYALIESESAPWRCFWSSVDFGGYRSEERRRGLKVRPAAMGLGAISCTQRHICRRRVRPKPAQRGATPTSVPGFVVRYWPWRSSARRYGARRRTGRHPTRCAQRSGRRGDRRRPRSVSASRR